MKQQLNPSKEIEGDASGHVCKWVLAHIDINTPRSVRSASFGHSNFDARCCPHAHTNSDSARTMCLKSDCEMFCLHAQSGCTFCSGVCDDLQRRICYAWLVRWACRNTKQINKRIPRISRRREKGSASRWKFASLCMNISTIYHKTVVSNSFTCTQLL